jgi:hypothetical protein
MRQIDFTPRAACIRQRIGNQSMPHDVFRGLSRRRWGQIGLNNMLYDLAPVIADVISAHCPGTDARERFLRACIHGHWDEVQGMVEGMLAEPWHLKGHQEARLREFLALVPITQQLDRAEAAYAGY